MNNSWCRLKVGLLLLGLSLFIAVATAPSVRNTQARATVPKATFSIADYGAVGDGKTLNTEAIQRAIDACTRQGGGTVYVPAGRFVTGTILLKDNVTLHLDEQAVL